MAEMNDEQLRKWQERLEASRVREAERERERRGYPNQFKVGDGATMHIGSDAHAFTVIKVSPSGKTITMQSDNYELANGWKPNIIPGGFAGHCTNNNEQTYTYERDPYGVTRQARLTKQGWMSRNAPVRPGRHAFHDYNF